MKAAKKVFYNTGFLYGKLIISMLIALYSTRIILKSLGAADFGVFSLIAGVIAMLSFLNGAMTVTTQRYMSHSLGGGEPEKIKEVFRTSVTLHLMIGLLMVLVLELIGLFLFDGWLNIPADRISAAKTIFQFMIVSTFFTINAVPYDAAINAHEDLLFDSVTGILEAVTKLLIAVYLTYTSFDKLITYGLLMALLTIIIRAVKTIWCTVRYSACEFRLRLSKNFRLLKEMTSYAGWNLFGSLCYIGSSQGLAVILNLFFGARINASYAVAYQVNSQLQNFSTMLVKAFNPQIVKSEGGGDRKRMIRLATKSSKLSTLLLLVIIIPVIIEIPFILKIWLSDVPEYTTIFCMLVLISAVIRQMSTGLKTAVQAAGQVKLYQAVVGTSILLILPVSYLLLKLGYPPYAVLIGSVVMEVISLCLRLKIVNKITGFPIALFAREVVLRVTAIAAVTAVPALFPALLMKAGYLRLAAVSLTSIFISCLMVWHAGFSHQERGMLLNIIKGLLNKSYGKTIPAGAK